MYKIISYQVADFIDIKNLKSAISSKLLYSDSSELFYETKANSYTYIFRYGVVSFSNHEADEISSFLKFLNPYCRNFFTEAFSDELVVEPEAPENKIGHNKIEI
jgi:hypothetical protein